MESVGIRDGIRWNLVLSELESSRITAESVGIWNPHGIVTSVLLSVMSIHSTITLNTCKTNKVMQKNSLASMLLKEKKAFEIFMKARKTFNILRCEHIVENCFHNSTCGVASQKNMQERVVYVKL